MAKRDSSQLSSPEDVRTSSPDDQTVRRTSKRRLTQRKSPQNDERNLPVLTTTASHDEETANSPSDSLMSETSTVDRENGTDRDTALVPNLGDDNVNSSLSIEQRTKEWLLSIEDIKKIKVSGDDQCYDKGILDPVLQNLDPPLNERLPPLSRRPFREWNGAYEGYIGLVISDALDGRSADPRSKFSADLIRDLYLYQGSGRVVNYINVDPLRMCPKISRSSTGRVTVCLGVKQHPYGHPLYRDEEPRMAQLLTLGIVTASSLLAPLENRRGSKILFAQTPSMFSDRLMTIVHAGFGRFSENALFRAQISTNMGFEFSTRGESTDPARAKSSARLVTPVRSNRFKPVVRSKPDVPLAAEGSSYSEIAYSLPSNAKVPVYDGRYTTMDLRAEKPFETLPSFDGELGVEDVVWIGFHCHSYKNLDHDFVSFNIAWVVLLHHQPAAVCGSE